jgi:hypothetical protein
MVSPLIQNMSDLQIRHHQRRFYAAQQESLEVVSFLYTPAYNDTIGGLKRNRYGQGRLKFLYSWPKPMVSSTAMVSFCCKASKDLYGGKSKRLKLEAVSIISL